MTFALSAASISRHGCSPMIVPRAILFTLTARLPPVVKVGLSMTAIWLTLFSKLMSPQISDPKGTNFRLGLGRWIRHGFHLHRSLNFEV